MIERRYLFLSPAIIGIIILLFLSSIIPPQILKINKITEKLIGKEIQIEAKIINIRDYPQQSFQVLTLEDKTGNITATSNSKKQLKINSSKVYIITGKIEENFYNNKTTLQLSIDKIMS